MRKEQKQQQQKRRNFFLLYYSYDLVRLASTKMVKMKSECQLFTPIIRRNKQPEEEKAKENNKFFEIINTILI
jgi:hypothetical protein